MLKNACKIIFMRKWALATSFLLSILPTFAQEAESTPEINKTPQFTLNSAIVLAIENNYDIQKQRSALATAKAQYRQATGALDFQAGAQAQYSMKQNPVDSADPNYKYGYSFLTPKDNTYGIFSKNTLAHQTGGSLFLKKLFSFGLESKISYTLQRSHNFPDYTYDKYFDALAESRGYSKYSQEMGRNVGELSLELSLPLFKSFANSITANQINSAQDYMHQMEYTLKDTISRSLISVSKLYWNYFITYKIMQQYEILQKKIEERNVNMSSLIAAGIRSKNDLLAMQLNVTENRRQLENSKVQFRQAKMELMTGIGVSDMNLIGEPQNPFSEVDLSAVNLPTLDEITDEMFAYIEANRSDFLTLSKRKHAAELKIKAAKVNLFPDANLNFGIGVTGTSYSDSAFNFLTAGFWNVRGANISGLLGVSAKLGNNEKKGVLEQAEAEYKAIVSEYNKIKNTLILQIENATEKLTTYKIMVSDADSVLSMQQNLYKKKKKRFRAGLITVDNLLNQDQKFLEAESSYYQLMTNYMQSVLEYKYYTATLVDIDSKSIFEVKNFYNEKR